jgi:hypothetical protein
MDRRDCTVPNNRHPPDYIARRGEVWGDSGDEIRLRPGGGRLVRFV